MSFIRGVLWFLLILAILAVAMYVTGNYELVDRLTGLFLQVQPWLPLSFTFEQFLLLVTVASLLAVALSVAVCLVLLVNFTARLSFSQQKHLGAAAAARRELDHVKTHYQQQYEQLIAQGQALIKRLDKRVLVQTILEAASRMTSVPQANSLASLWLVRFETDTLGFEMGLYCDATLFTQTEFQPTEQPFARVTTSEKPLLLPSWEQTTLLKSGKTSLLGSATGVILVPLVIESSVLGVLVLFCHPDIIKSYEAQKLFYDAVWGELSLALAIAIQGELAILDRLTGAHNREYFMKRLVQELERSNRFRLSLALLMIDIDNFKLVNDTLGHPQGDAVLKIISKLIKKEVRAIDLVGRYGGEEFIVLLPETGYGEDASSTTGALVVAERIRKAVDEEFRGLQKPLNLTISVGVAIRRFPEDRDADYKELIRLADEQLYRAKTTGKNKVRVFLPGKAQEVS